MARPQKNNAEYFSHDSTMRNDMKIKALRKRYGIEGYGLYCMLLEIISACDYFEYIIDPDDYIAWELFAGDIDMDTDHLREMLEYMTKIGLIAYEGSKIYSEGLKKRLQGVVEKRDKIREVRSTQNTQKSTQPEVCADKSDNKPPNIGVCDTQTIVCATQMPQSKVKETKVKEIKENTETQVPACDFSFFWEKYPKQAKKTDAQDEFSRLTDKEISELQEVFERKTFPNWLEFWSTIEVRYVPSFCDFLSKKRWTERVPEYKKPPVKSPEKLPETLKNEELAKRKRDESAWEKFMGLEPDTQADIERRATISISDFVKDKKPLVRANIIAIMHKEY